MLTKQAQEEVYSAYYNHGVELALGQVKVAGKTKEVVKKMIQLPAAGVGNFYAQSIDLPHTILSPKILDIIGDDVVDYAYPALAMGSAGAGSLAAYKTTGKAVDLADAGIQKLVQMNKDLKKYQRRARVFNEIERSIPGLKTLRKAIVKQQVDKKFKDTPIRKYIVNKVTDTFMS